MAFAVEPKSKADEEKIGEALQRLMDEDLTLRVSRDPDTHEYLLSGTGQLHIEIAVAKLRTATTWTWSSTRPRCPTARRW